MPFLGALLLALVFSSPLAAAELHVPAAYASVAEALDAAAAGDEIVLAPGVFPLSVERSGVSVTIRGAGRDLSVLDGEGATVFTLSHTDLTLRDLTVRNGRDGLYLEDGSVVVERVRFEGSARDGLELSRRSSAVVTDAQFVGNGDDGISLGRNSSLRCTSCLIRDNGGCGIDVRLHDFTGPLQVIELAASRIEDNAKDGVQLIDYFEPTARFFHLHDVVIAGNRSGVVWRCCGHAGEEGTPPEPVSGDEPVRIERATIVNNEGPGISGGAGGMMDVRDSIVSGNGVDLHGPGGPLGSNLVGIDPLFTIDYRLSVASPAVGAGEHGGDLGAHPLRACSDGLDNDGDGLVDLADPHCPGLDHGSEAAPRPLGFGCGIGPELAPLLAGLLFARRHRARRA